MTQERAKRRIEYLRTIISSKAIRYSLFIASWFIITVIFCIIPYFQALITTLLADNGFQFAQNYPSATLAWSINPPSVTISSVHLEARGTSEQFPYIIEIHLDSIQYRVERTRFWRMKPPDVTPSLTQIASSPNPLMVRFATLSWHNITVSVHEPHPQPRLSILDGTIQLSLLSIRQQMQRRLYPKTGLHIPYNQSALLQLSIAKVGITTHSVTSIRIPITHPTTRQLIDRFPTFFSLFTTPATSMSDGAVNEHPIIYPPHLSLLAPSLVFPALYQGISSFRQEHTQDVSKKESGHQTYNFPTPFSHAIIQANFTRSGARRMRQMSLALIDESNSPHQCTPIHIGGMKSIELSGRDTDGKGGCCTFQVRDLGNLPTPDGHVNCTASNPTAVALGSRLSLPLNWMMCVISVMLVPHI
jgi:hypothetical protein